MDIVSTCAGGATLSYQTSQVVQAHQATTCRLLNLFLQDGPLYGAIHGPILATGQVEWESLQSNWKLSQRKLEEYYGDPWYMVGKRFGKLTSYLMLDADIASQYHPSNGPDQFQDLLGTCEDIGLVRPLLVRSSESGGLHIYFPLGEQLPTWKAARRLQRHLQQHGFELTGGQLELFPHPKADKSALYNGHRLPLQRGSCLLSSDLEHVSDQPADFIRAWKLASAANDFELYPHYQPAAARRATPKPIKRGQQQPATHINEQPPIQWTEHSQSNAVMRRLANWGYELLGLATVPELAAWMATTAPSLEGYQQFTSSDTRRDIEQGNWCERWAKSRIRRGGQVVLSGRADLNEARHQDAVNRAKAAIKAAAGQVFSTIRECMDFLISKSKEDFGVGFSIRTLMKLRTLWRHLLGDSSQRDPHTVDQRERSVTSQPANFSAVTDPPKQPLNFLERCRKIADRIVTTGQPAGFQGFEYPDSITSPPQPPG